MKTKYFLALASLGLALANCTNDEVVQTFENAKQTPIGFSTYVNGTRAATSGDVTTALMQSSEEGFGVVGYHSNSIYLGSTSAAVKQTWQGTEGSKTWEYAIESEKKYWPASGTMDFYAFFPSTATVTIAGANGSTSTPLTITSWTDGQDVLVGKALAQSSADRTALQFAHAFSKIKAVTLTKAADGAIKDYTVEVNEVQFLNTATKGSIKVSESGEVSYDGGNTARTKTLTSAVTASSTSANLIENDNNAYIFPTSSIWDGTKPTEGTLDLSSSTYTSVVMVLKAKVYKDTDYKVGTSDSYGEIYIPIKTAPSTAGKRYTYNITMKDEVGYKKDGDPIFGLKPIKFSASVTEWADETAISITL